jgi:acetyl esterase
MQKLAKIFLWFLGSLLGLALAVWVAFQVSPWPAVWLIRHTFDAGAAAASGKLQKHLPADVTARTDLVYDAASPNGKLDVYYPASAPGKRLTTVVWVHGGGYVSGRKEDIGNYCRILAGRGFTVVSVDYTIAPEAKYPAPVRQANAALAWLARNEAGLPVDPGRIVLAGDSAGSGIVAQLANVISVPAYAREVGITPAIPRSHLAGLLLNCGVYGVDGINLDGPFGGFLKTVLWAYFGRKDALSDPRLDQFSVARHVTAEFPPVFITAGNADPLLPQSQALAAALKARGVAVDELFFPPDQTPPLGHEYQFDLDTEAGRLALERTVRFLATR